MISILNKLDGLLVALASFALCILLALITASVIGRYLLNVPVPDDVVISEMLLVAVGFLPLAQVQARKEHIFVNMFTDWMSTNAKVILETVGQIAGLVFFVVVTFAVYTDAKAAWDNGAFSLGRFNIPEWPARSVVVLGLGLFSFRLFLDVLANIVGVMTGTASSTVGEADRVIAQQRDETPKEAE